MFSIAGIDLLEQELLDHERTLLEILLQDKTTKKNIIWATDDYAELGERYSFKRNPAGAGYRRTGQPDSAQSGKSTGAPDQPHP